MDETKITPAAHGYYMCALSLFEQEREYRLSWHPVVAWRVWDEVNLAEPIVVGDHCEWGSNEKVGAVLSPSGKFLYDGCVETSLERWLCMQIDSYESEVGVKHDFAAWKEIDPKPLPVTPSAPAEIFQPDVFRPTATNAPKKTSSPKKLAAR